jgi:glucose-fructose oxidoreductase
MKKIRYAVVGLGHIAQKAVLPAFAHTAHSRVAALVSGDQKKMAQLAAAYDVKNCFYYEDYDQCLASGDVDAVFIALPNTMHKEFALRAFEKGVHVLVEKPMEMTSAACQEMIAAGKKADLKLMVAYRLHFEEANLLAVKLLAEQRIGEPRYFSSVFSYQVKPEDFRTNASLGGGPLVDIGVYCINAARYLFQDEPTEVMAVAESSQDNRFAEVDEMLAVTMRFPKNRLAQFMCSFGAAPTVCYQVVGSQGTLVLDEAFGYTMDKVMKVTVDGKTETITFPRSQQFAAQIDYFSYCILEGKQPKPDGIEGLKDVAIMEAIVQSVAEKRPVPLV